MKETYVLFWLCIGIMAICLCSGCASRTGWEVRFGVAPVTAINNNTSLEQDRE